MWSTTPRLRVHFASPASPIDYLELPIQTLKVGALGTHKALGVAKARGAKFLLASTSEVYGDPLVHPQPEEYWGNVNPVGPRGVYDEAKRFAEAMTMAYHRFHGVDTRIVRIFNTYGPRMRLTDGRAIPTFIRQALRGDPITVAGDGSQTRSFTHYSDLVDGIWRLMNEPVNDPVNIGNPREMTLLALARMIIELTGSPSELVFTPLPVDDPKVRQPESAARRPRLEPRWDVETGCARPSSGIARPGRGGENPRDGEPASSAPTWWTLFWAGPHRLGGGKPRHRQSGVG